MALPQDFSPDPQPEGRGLWSQCVLMLDVLRTLFEELAGNTSRPALLSLSFLVATVPCWIAITTSGRDGFNCRMPALAQSQLLSALEF